MKVMEEYTGRLHGGPDGGNLITASKEMIPVKSIVEMWPDGLGKDSFIVETKGFYRWDDLKRYFTWRLEGSKAFIKKEEIV